LLFQRKTFIQTFWFPSKTFAQTWKANSFV
jgi:hypothetical protein